MGMGEPLDNYQQVLNAIEAMTDVSRFGLSPSRISVSTVGVVPRMWSLIQDAPQIGLALSLHAPNQTLRTQIVPSSKAWHLDRIMEAMDAFIENQNQSTSLNRKRHVLIEYVLIADVNDSEEIAHELGNLLQHRSVLLNVIPYNPTQVPFDYKSPSVKKTREFVDTVKSYGIHTLQRQELGQDIASACGQLVIKSAKPSTNAKTEIGDIEDLGSSKKKSVKMNKRQNSIQPLKQDSNFQARSSWEIGFLMILLISVLMYRWLS
jgi:sorting nexin-8